MLLFSTSSLRLGVWWVIPDGLVCDTGQFVETIVSGFGLKSSKVVKFMVYRANRGVFPLHNNEPHVLNKFRVTIFFSPASMPDFVMRFKRTQNVFEIRRGPLAVVVRNGYARRRQAQWQRTTGIDRARHFASVHARRGLLRV
jgi:hypothetical protein